MWRRCRRGCGLCGRWRGDRALRLRPGAAAAECMGKSVSTRIIPVARSLDPRAVPKTSADEGRHPRLCRTREGKSRMAGPGLRRDMLPPPYYTDGRVSCGLIGTGIPSIGCPAEARRHPLARIHRDHRPHAERIGSRHWGPARDAHCSPPVRRWGRWTEPRDLRGVSDAPPRRRGITACQAVSISYRDLRQPWEFATACIRTPQ